ncbi:MAG: ATP-binding protein [Lachnospiraceae bacterium]|nr:ATP-binding protein [Lachnospiraceae bacterium]
MSRVGKVKWKIPERPECFFGRDLELSQLDFILHNGANIVFVQGIGGIGKSELVKQYARINRDKYDTIVYSQYVSDLQTMIASDVEFPMENMRRNTIDAFNIEREEEYFKRKFIVLKETITENTLLIVDNFNNPDDCFLQEFLTLNCKIIFTSRCDWSKKQYPVLCVEELKNLSDIEKIFQHYYLLKPEEEEVVKEIIELVFRHTLSVEWIAKKLAEQNRKPEEIRNALKCNQGEKEETGFNALLDRLSEIFSVSELSEAEQEILRNLCFVPYTGISKEDMARRCKYGAHAAMLRLLHNSWIKQVELDVITLHPVISDTILYKLKPNWKNCQTFIESVEKDLLDDETDVIMIDNMITVSEKIFQILGIKEVQAVDLLNAVSYAFVSRYKKYDIAMGLLQKAITIQDSYLEQLRGKIDLCKIQDTSDITYNELNSKIYSAEHKKYLLQKNYGGLKYKLGNYEEALTCFMNLSKNSLVDVYCDIARIYQKVNEYQKAMQYVKAGIKMKERKYRDNKVPLIENYLLLAELYLCQQDKRMALEWLEKGREIAKTQMSLEEQGDFYYQYGILLKNAGYLEEALSCDQKAYIARKRKFGEEHIEVVKSYAAMSVDYYRLGDYISALECTLREIAIRKKIRHVKVRLYMSVSRLLHFVDTNQLSSETVEELKAFMADFNRMMKENPMEGQEMMRE